ncbi:MAG: hypothetical protein KME26_28105 [Oscillatoria princeps RMCB-10]|nr:hypothetical protein [Oscillatoria princeps RMCB-10]
MAVSTPHRHLTPEALVRMPISRRHPSPTRPPRQQRGGGRSLTRPAAGFAKGARL